MGDSASRDVRATFAVTGLTPELYVLGFEGEEGLSRLFEFQIELASTAADIAFTSVVGKAACLTIARDDEPPRHVNGMVSAFRLRQRGPRYALYTATVVPRVWRLLHVHDCRIFQKKTTEQIVDEVLSGAGYGADEYTIHKDKGKASAKRTFCVQYRESHWAFVCRILEETGYYYFFEHEQDKHTLVIANGTTFHPAISGQVKVPFHPPDAMLPGAEHVAGFSFCQTISPSKVTLSDYNLLKHALDRPRKMKVEQTGDKMGQDATIEFYDYGVDYRLPGVGKDLAKVRLEELQSLARTGSGLGDCTRFVAGYHFVLDGYFRDDLDDKKYVLTEVRHVGAKTEDIEAGAVTPNLRYHNEFGCIRRNVPFRPPQETPKPTADGVQTATVVGPTSEEIYTDDEGLGRVKVQFHWDRQGKWNESSSCWVPVSQAWAGAGWGATYIPRIGDEVVVDFVEGDMDRPIIVGRLYHSNNVPPLSLPRDKTKSTIKSNSTPGGGGSNEIRFEDKKGSEEVYVHAQKDQNEKVENNLSTTVGADHSVSVGSNRTVTVDGSQNVVIKGEKASGGVTGGSLNITGDYKVDASNTIEIQAPTHIKLTCGGSSVLIEPGTITLTAGGAAQVVLDANALMQSAAGSKVFLDGNALTSSSGGSSVLLDGNADMSSSGGSQVLLDGNANVNSSGGSQVLLDGNATVTSSGGSQVLLDGDATMSTPGSAKVQGGADATVSGPKAVLQGSAGSVQATANVDVNAPTININGGAAVNVTGGIIKLN